MGFINLKKLSEPKDYYLMMKDICVCTIHPSGKIEICREDLLPFDIYLESGSDADYVNNLVNFYAWCASRLLSIDRIYAKEILNSVGLSTARTDKERSSIALSYNCLSLKDFYWVTDNLEKDYYSNINLFDNSLGDIIDISLRGKVETITNSKLISKDLTTDGRAPKAWVRNKNSFKLYKGDLPEYEDSSVLNEVRASRALQELGFECIKYESVSYQGNITSICDCFTSKDIGWVTAEMYNMNYELSDLIDTYKEQFWIMNLCDYLIGNSDRHGSNWGILFNDKREVIGLTPLFDFDHAFRALPNYICLPLQLLGKNMSYLEAASYVVKLFNIDVKKLLNNCSDAYVKDRLKLLIS